MKIRNAVLPIVAAAAIGTPVAFAEQASASPAVKSAASAKSLFIDAYRTRNGCTFSEHPRTLKAGQSVVISPDSDVSVVVDVPTVKASRLRSGYSTTAGTASVNSANTLTFTVGRNDTGKKIAFACLRMNHPRTQKQDAARITKGISLTPLANICRRIVSRRARRGITGGEAFSVNIPDASRSRSSHGRIVGTTQTRTTAPVACSAAARA